MHDNVDIAKDLQETRSVKIFCDFIFDKECSITSLAYILYLYLFLISQTTTPQLLDLGFQKKKIALA